MANNPKIQGALIALREAAARLNLPNTEYYVVTTEETGYDKIFQLKMQMPGVGEEDTPFRTDLGWNSDLAYHTLTTITRTINDVRRVLGSSVAIQIGDRGIQHNTFEG